MKNGRHGQNGSNSKGFLLGALLGAAAGAAAALFLAPKSGKDMRQGINEQASLLKEKSGRLRELAADKKSQITEAAKEKTNQIKEKLSLQSTEMINKVKGLKEAENETNLEQESSSVGSDIQRKLEETKKAFDETEAMLNNK